jgi:hypothetical protein
MTAENPKDPYYTPIQVLERNSCSHLCEPRGDGEVSFYIYPCKRAHLAHANCFLEYCKQERAREECEYCVREFGETVHLDSIDTTKRNIKIAAISLFLLVLLFTFLYVFLWSNY